MPITRAKTIQGVTQGLRLVLETGVCRVVHIQPRHLVETDHPVDWSPGQISLQPAIEFLVASMIGQGLYRRNQHLETVRHLPFPDQCIDPDAMAPRLADLGNTHKITLQPTKGKVLVEHKSQLHQIASDASKGCNRAMTWAGLSRVKHSGCSQIRSNCARSSAVGW